MGDVVAWAPRIVEAWWLTMRLAVLSGLVAAIVAFVAGMTLLYASSPVRLPVRAYVDLVRGLPLLVLLFTVFYGSAATGSNLDTTVAVLIAMSAFGGAHGAEVVRAGIGSIASQYQDAGRSLGLDRWHRFSLVTLPLAFPRMLPPAVNISVEILKGTSLASLIGAPELMYVTQSAAGSTFNPLPFYLVAGTMYLGTILVFSQIGSWSERRVQYTEY